MMMEQVLMMMMMTGQVMMKFAEGEQRQAIVSRVQRQIPLLQKYTFGQQIIGLFCLSFPFLSALCSSPCSQAGKGPGVPGPPHLLAPAATIGTRDALGSVRIGCFTGSWVGVPFWLSAQILQFPVDIGRSCYQDVPLAKFRCTTFLFRRRWSMLAWHICVSVALRPIMASCRISAPIKFVIVDLG